jgi:hypothetical protein
MFAHWFIVGVTKQLNGCFWNNNPILNGISRYQSLFARVLVKRIPQKLN